METLTWEVSFPGVKEVVTWVVRRRSRYGPWIVSKKCDRWWYYFSMYSIHGVPDVSVTGFFGSSFPRTVSPVQNTFSYRNVTRDYLSTLKVVVCNPSTVTSVFLIYLSFKFCTSLSSFWTLSSLHFITVLNTCILFLNLISPFPFLRHLHSFVFSSTCSPVVTIRLFNSFRRVSFIPNKHLYSRGYFGTSRRKDRENDPTCRSS